LYLELGDSSEPRQAAYRELFRTGLDEAALAELRLAIQQSQPIGSERFLQQIEQMTGQRREARPRGRPRLEPDGPAVLRSAQRGQARINFVLDSQHAKTPYVCTLPTTHITLSSVATTARFASLPKRTIE